MYDNDFKQIEKIREGKKEKSDLRSLLNKKDFDSFELDMLMNEAE